MLLPICLDPIQAWTWLKKTRPRVLMSLFLSVSSPVLPALPLSSLFPRQLASLWPQPKPSNTTGHFTAWSHDQESSSPWGHHLARGPMTAKVIWVELIALFSLTFNNASPPLTQISLPFNHASGTSKEDQSAYSSINTGPSWQNTYILGHWGT